MSRRTPTTTRYIKNLIDDLQVDEIEYFDGNIGIGEKRIKKFTKDWFYALKTNKFNALKFLESYATSYDGDVFINTESFTNDIRKKYNRKYGNLFKKMLSNPVFQEGVDTFYGPSNGVKVPVGYAYSGILDGEAKTYEEGDVINFSKITSIKKVRSSSKWSRTKQNMDRYLVNKPYAIDTGAHIKRKRYYAETVRVPKIVMRRAVEYAITKRNRQTNIVFLLKGDLTTRYGKEKNGINVKLIPTKQTLKNINKIMYGNRDVASGVEEYGSDPERWSFDWSDVREILAFNQYAKDSYAYVRLRSAGAFFPWLLKPEYKETLAPLLKRYGIYAKVDPANYENGCCLYKCFERATIKNKDGEDKPKFTQEELTRINYHCSKNLINRMVATCKLSDMAKQFELYLRLTKRFDYKIINGEMSYEWRDECVIHHRFVSKIHCIKCTDRPTFGADVEGEPTHCKNCKQSGMVEILDVCRSCYKKFEAKWLEANPGKTEVPKDISLKEISKIQKGCTKPKYAPLGFKIGVRCYQCKLPTDVEMYKCPCYYEHLQGKRKALTICNHERHYFLREKVKLTDYALQNTSELFEKFKGTNKEWNTYVKGKNKPQKGYPRNFRFSHKIIGYMLKNKDKYFEKKPIDTNAAILSTYRADNYDHKCPTQPLRVPKGMFKHNPGELQEIQDCFYSDKQLFLTDLKEMIKTQGYKKKDKDTGRETLSIPMVKVYNLLINIKEEKKQQLDIKISNGKKITIGLIEKWDIKKIRKNIYVFGIGPQCVMDLEWILQRCEISNLRELQQEAYSKMFYENNKTKRTYVNHIYSQISFAADTETYTDKSEKAIQKVLSVGYQFVNYKSYRKMYSDSYEEKEYFTEHAIYDTVFKDFHNSLKETGYQQFYSKDGECKKFIIDFMDSVVEQTKLKSKSKLEIGMNQLELDIKNKDKRFKGLSKEELKEKIEEEKELIINKFVKENIGEDLYHSAYLPYDVLKTYKRAVKLFNGDIKAKLLFHNARFDITTLYDSSQELRKNFTLNGVTEPEGTILSHDGVYKCTPIAFNCTTRLFGPVKLSKLPESYGFSDKVIKGDFFYSLLKDFKKLYKPMTKKEIFHTAIGYCSNTKHHLECTDLITHQFNKEVNAQGHFTAIRKVNWKKWDTFIKTSKDFTNDDGTIDMLGYCLHYMKNDVLVLKLALEANHFQNRELTEGIIDCRCELTCSGIGDKYLVRKFYGDDVFTIRGQCADFIKEKCVVGGRCQNRQNKSVITGFERPQYPPPQNKIEELRQEAVKNTSYMLGKMLKLDASSLYPYAAALCGILKGVPKVILSGTSIKELFSKTQFFAKVKLALKPKSKQGPEKPFSEHSYIDKDTKSRVWTNTFEATDHIVVLNREVYHAMKLWNRFYDMEKTEILGGYYFDQGYDRTICKKIRDLFKQRIQLKVTCVKCGKHKREHTDDYSCVFQKNSLEQLIKLLLNSSVFGKSIQKWYSTDTVVKSKNKFLDSFKSEEEADLCIEQMEKSCKTCKNPMYIKGGCDQEKILKLFENSSMTENIKNIMESSEFVSEEIFDLERCEYLYKFQEEYLLKKNLIQKPIPDQYYNCEKFKTTPPKWLISKEKMGSGCMAKPKWQVYREQLQIILRLNKPSQKVCYGRTHKDMAVLRPTFTSLAGEDMKLNNTFDPMYRTNKQYNQITGQRMKRELRSNIFAKNYIDCDISSAFPTMLLILMLEKNIATDPKYDTLVKYCRKREKFFKKVFKAGFKGDRSSLKKTCLKYLFQPNTTLTNRRVPEILIQLQEQCKLIKDEFYSKKWANMTSKKHEGAALSAMLQHKTAKVLKTAVDHLKSKGHEIASIIFDGMLVRNNKPLDFDELNRMVNEEFLVSGCKLIKFMPKKFEDVVEIDKEVVENEHYKTSPVNLSVENGEVNKSSLMGIKEINARLKIFNKKNKLNLKLQSLPNKASVYFRNKLEKVEEDKFNLTTDDAKRFMSYNSHKIHSVSDNGREDYKTYHKKIKIHNDRSEYWTRSHIGASILSYSKFAMGLYMNRCGDSFGSGDTDSFSGLESDLMKGAEIYRKDPFTIDWKLGCFYRHDTPKSEWRKRFVMDNEFFTEKTIQERKAMTTQQLQTVINDPNTYEQLTNALGDRLGEFNSDLEMVIDDKTVDAYFDKSCDKAKKNYVKLIYADDSKGKRHYKIKIAAKGVPLNSLWYHMTRKSKAIPEWINVNKRCFHGKDCKLKNCKILDKVWRKRVTDTHPLSEFKRDVEMPIRMTKIKKNKSKESKKVEKKRVLMNAMIEKYDIQPEDLISVTCPLKTEFRYRDGQCCHGITSEKINQSTTDAAKETRAQFEKYKETLFKRYIKSNIMVSRDFLEQERINNSVES